MPLKKKISDIIKVVVFLGIGIFFIWYFLLKLEAKDKAEILNSFTHANYYFIVLSVGVALMSHIIRTLRWQMLLRAAGQNPGFMNTFLSLMIGYFANLAFPRLGEVTRCGLLDKYEKVPFTVSFGTVISERALDLVTFVILFFITLISQYQRVRNIVSQKVYTPLSEKFEWFGKGYILWAAILLLAICIVLIIIYHKKLIHFKPYALVVGVVKGFWIGLKSIAKIKNPILFIIYTLGIWTCYFFMTWIVFFSLSEVAGIGPVPAFSVLVIGTIGIMVSPGGIGLYPGLVAGTLLAYFPDPAREIVFLSLGWLLWGTQTVAIIIAGITALIILPIINSVKHGSASVKQK